MTYKERYLLDTTDDLSRFCRQSLNSFALNIRRAFVINFVSLPPLVLLTRKNLVLFFCLWGPLFNLFEIEPRILKSRIPGLSEKMDNDSLFSYLLVHIYHNVASLFSMRLRPFQYNLSNVGSFQTSIDNSTRPSICSLFLK